jgi:hypothetical protein
VVPKLRFHSSQFCNLDGGVIPLESSNGDFASLHLKKNISIQSGLNLIIFPTSLYRNQRFIYIHNMMWYATSLHVIKILFFTDGIKINP